MSVDMMTLRSQEPEETGECNNLRYSAVRTERILYVVLSKASLLPW